MKEGREQGREEERNKRAREEAGGFFGGGALSFPTHPLPSVDGYVVYVAIFLGSSFRLFLLPTLPEFHAGWENEGERAVAFFFWLLCWER